MAFPNHLDLQPSKRPTYYTPPLPGGSGAATNDDSGNSKKESGTPIWVVVLIVVLVLLICGVLLAVIACFWHFSKPRRADANLAGIDGHGNVGPVNGKQTDFLHGEISRAEAEATLRAASNGTKTGHFLVRSKGDSFVLSVVVGDRIEHHMISTGPSGTFKLNSYELEATCTTLSDVIVYLQTNGALRSAGVKKGLGAKLTTGECWGPVVASIRFWLLVALLTHPSHLSFSHYLQD